MLCINSQQLRFSRGWGTECVGIVFACECVCVWEGTVVWGCVTVSVCACARFSNSEVSSEL